MTWNCRVCVVVLFSVCCAPACQALSFRSELTNNTSRNQRWGTLLHPQFWMLSLSLSLSCPSIWWWLCSTCFLCRRMWLLSPKAEAPTWPHTVQAYPCRVVVGCGWLRCWCLCTCFATGTSICCCSKVASPLSQTARHSSRSLANSSSLSKGIPHLL